MEAIPHCEDVPAWDGALKIIEVPGLDCLREKRFRNRHYHMPRIGVKIVESTQLFGEGIVVLPDAAESPLARTELRRCAHAILLIVCQHNKIFYGTLAQIHPIKHPVGETPDRKHPCF